MAKDKELSLPAEVRKLEASNIAQKSSKTTKNCQDIMSWIEELFSGRRLQLDIIVMLMHGMNKSADEILLWNDAVSPQNVITEFEKLLKRLGYRIKGEKWIQKLKKNG